MNVIRRIGVDSIVRAHYHPLRLSEFGEHTSRAFDVIPIFITELSVSIFSSSGTRMAMTETMMAIPQKPMSQFEVSSRAEIYCPA
jgi:hypothetical protein